MILSNKNKVIKCKLIAWLWNHIYIVYYYIWSYSVCVCGVIMYVYVCLRVHDQIACTCVIANVKPYSVAWHQTIVYCYTVSYWLNIYIYIQIYTVKCIYIYIYSNVYIYISEYIPCSIVINMFFVLFFFDQVFKIGELDEGIVARVVTTFLGLATSSRDLSKRFSAKKISA